MRRLILTAAVVPAAPVARADPAVRRADYDNAIRRWISSSAFDEIIIAEGSGATIVTPSLKEFANYYCVALRDITLDLSQVARRYGKGRAEALLLNEAVRIVPHSAVFHKATGRLFVTNHALLSNEVGDVRFSMSPLAGQHIDTRFFRTTREYYDDKIRPLTERIDDASVGSYIENVYPRDVPLFRQRPRYAGYNATTNAPLDDPGGSTDYEIFCAWHRVIRPEIYGTELHRPVFVKLGTGPSEGIQPPRSLDLYSYPTSMNMGRHWAETELLLNLYRADRAGLYRLPQFVGAIHYDMSWTSSGRTVSDHMEQAVREAQDATMFIPLPIKSFAPQADTFGFSTALDFCRRVTGGRPTNTELMNARLAACSAIVVHRDVFRRLGAVLELLAHHEAISSLDIKTRIQGHIAERVTALFLHTLNLRWHEFPLHHEFATGR